MVQPLGQQPGENRMTPREFVCADCGSHVHSFDRLYGKDRCLECRVVMSVEPQYRPEIWQRFHPTTPMPIHVMRLPVEPLYPEAKPK